MLQTLLDFFSGKAKTRIYTTFLGWLAVFHLDIIFISLLTDQTLIYEKTKMLKGEYILQYVSHYGSWSILLEIFRILLSVLLTYLMIWVIPKLINRRSYQQELEIEYELRYMKVLKDEAMNSREESAIEKQLENIELEKQVIVEKNIVNEKPEQVAWDKDFENFKSSSSYQSFDNVIEIVYEYKGNYIGRSSGYRPNSRVLAYLDSNEIIVIENGTFAFTEKGKYFVKKYTELRNSNKSN